MTHSTTNSNSDQFSFSFSLPHIDYPNISKENIQSVFNDILTQFINQINIPTPYIIRLIHPNHKIINLSRSSPSQEFLFNTNNLNTTLVIEIKSHYQSYLLKGDGKHDLILSIQRHDLNIFKQLKFILQLNSTKQSLLHPISPQPTKSEITQLFSLQFNETLTNQILQTLKENNINPPILQRFNVPFFINSGICPLQIHFHNANHATYSLQSPTTITHLPYHMQQTLRYIIEQSIPPEGNITSIQHLKELLHINKYGMNINLIQHLLHIANKLNLPQPTIDSLKVASDIMATNTINLPLVINQISI